jgi:hypothetical protein
MIRIISFKEPVRGKGFKDLSADGVMKKRFKDLSADVADLRRLPQMFQREMNRLTPLLALRWWFMAS